MALKKLKTKKSKRLTGRLKHKIDKKVRDHNRKVRREAKKNPKKGSKKQKLIQIPNICPFKEDILKEVEETRKRQEEEQQTRRNVFKAEREQHKFKSLETMVKDANIRAGAHSIMIDSKIKGDAKVYKNAVTKEQSLKQFFKEFRKVIENADVVLEVVDARDPLGTRCSEVERVVRGMPGNKRLVLVLNKADLVPRENLKNWIKYFRRIGPVTAFKASTQDQASRLGRRKLKEMKNEKAMQGSVCIGAELLMSMLGNYCRNKGIKTSIRVGVVGIPNVGKSSIINSLARGRSCMVGSTPGITKSMQEVELDSKIKLIDCPGIVFSSGVEVNENSHAVLKNAQRVGDVKDPFTIAESVLKRASKEYFCKLYDITNYDSFEEFFAKKAARMGKFLKKGVPDVVTAARSVLDDWNTGKIKYCTQPPEDKNDSTVHVSAAIIYKEACEFNIDNFELMETDVLRQCAESTDNFMEITSTGPLKIGTLLEEKPAAKINEKDSNISTRKRKLEKGKEKVDAVLLLEENQSINKNIKEQQKKKKKLNARNEKNITKITDFLDGFNLGPSSSSYPDKYDFDEDYVIV